MLKISRILGIWTTLCIVIVLLVSVEGWRKRSDSRPRFRKLEGRTLTARTGWRKDQSLRSPKSAPAPFPGGGSRRISGAVHGVIGAGVNLGTTVIGTGLNVVGAGIGAVGNVIGSIIGGIGSGLKPGIGCKTCGGGGGGGSGNTGGGGGGSGNGNAGGGGTGNGNTGVGGAAIWAQTCLFNICIGGRIEIRFPTCTFARKYTFGVVPLTLGLFCRLLLPKHKCCKSKPVRPPVTVEPPVITESPITVVPGGICPLAVCAICHGGTCNSVGLPYPSCFFSNLITWNAAQLTLPTFCAIFNPEHQCCRGSVGGSGVEGTQATCLFGVCVQGGLSISASCQIANPPRFGSVILNIRLLCRFIDASHRCCANAPQITIDSQCPLGICPEGRIDIDWPDCVIVGSGTWNGIQLSLPLICLLFISDHKCCKYPPVTTVVVPQKPPINGGFIGEIIGGVGGKICIFSNCIPDDGSVAITADCVIMNPPLIGGHQLIIAHICNYINPDFRCCKKKPCSAADCEGSGSGEIEGGGSNGECERIEKNGKICVYFVCKRFASGSIEITPNCMIKNPPRIGIHRLTIPLLCKFSNPNHRCCGGQCSK